MRPKRRNDTRVLYIDRERKKKKIERTRKLWCGKEDRNCVQWHCTTIWKRDVAQLGSAFVLGTKCHRFKSCHPYLLILSSLWAVVGRSIKVGITWICGYYTDVRHVRNRKGFSFFFFVLKALLVQFGRTRVSKTRCRRFKSYRAWFHISYVETKIT